MLDNSPRFQMIELDEVVSTNTFLRSYRPLTPVPVTLVTAEYQTAGRGQAGNTWESTRGENLLFSLQVRPSALPAANAFVLSEAIALSLREAIASFISAEDVNVKWPNDIYVADSKISGILIENDFRGSMVERSIIGCGVDVNQQAFTFPTLPLTESSDAASRPIPVSLRQLLGHDTERRFVLDAIITAFRRRYDAIEGGSTQGISTVHTDYCQSLYRRQGLHNYRDASGTFSAEIADVEPSGHLCLRDTEGNLRRYAFKEVAYC